MRRAWPLLLSVSLLACAGSPRDPSCPDAHCVAPADAGGDAGQPDAAVDAGAPDAGFDGGPVDAGADADAGSDGGLDAGPVDAGCGPLDAGDPPNQLLNPGFECGDPPSDWVPSAAGSLASESANPRSGARAARLVSDDGGAPVSLFPQVPRANSGVNTWCASAWVRGVPAGGTARLSLWTMTATGGLVETTFSAPSTPGFAELRVSAVTQPLDNRVLLRLWLPNPAKGDALVVDDVEQWQSADGGCASR